MITFRGARPYTGDNAFLLSCRIQPIPTIETENAIIPLCAGVLNASKAHRQREINLSFELLGHSAKQNAQIAESIIVWAESSNDEPFIFDETPDRYYLAKLTHAGDVDYAEEYPVLDLTFTCTEQPYAQSIVMYSSAVGRAIEYTGTVATWPCIRFTPATNVVAPAWSDGNRIISFDETYTAAAGHEIIIDCENRYATDNGESIMPFLLITSDWLKLERGSNQISGSGGYVEWRNVYL